MVGEMAHLGLGSRGAIMAWSMPKPWELPLFVGLSMLAALAVAYFIGIVGRRLYYHRRLGKRWACYRSRGREVWMLESADGETLEKVRQTPGGRWATSWGREFDSLIEAARWLESKHPSS